MRLASRQTLLLVLFALVLLLPLGVLGAYLVAKYNWAEAKLAELEPRYARLLGLEASKAKMAAAMAASTQLISRFVYPSTFDISQAGNDAQQRIRDITTSAGLSILSSQVLPPKSESRFDRVPLAVRLEGELPALQAALVVLSSQTPAINFESFAVQTYGAVRADVPQRLSIQFSAFVLRAKP